MVIDFVIILVIWVAMIATAFWEAAVEEDEPWEKGKAGWQIISNGRVLLTSYHFWLFFVMFPALLAVPLIIGFSVRLLGVLLTAYASGLVIEDFAWFIVNPHYGLKKFTPKHAPWQIWIKIGKKGIPASYIVGLLIAVGSWYFLWR